MALVRSRVAPCDPRRERLSIAVRSDNIMIQVWDLGPPIGERISRDMDNPRATSVRRTISELSDFGLSNGITQALGAVADSRPER